MKHAIGPPGEERRSQPRPVGAVRRALGALAKEAQLASRRVAGRQRVVALAGLLASLAIAAYGQHIIDDRGSLGAGWPLLSSFDSKLTTIYQAPQSVAFTVPLFVIAALLFVLSLRALLARPAAEPATLPPEQARPRGWPGLGRWFAPALVLAILAVGGWRYLIAQLALNQYEPFYWWLFWASLLCAGASFLLIDRRRGASLTSTLRFRPWEIALVAGLTGLFLGLVIQDLTNWRFARIGDADAFWRLARQIAEGQDDINLFSQRGVFSHNPVLGSAYQAVVMRVAGVDIFGWKLASTLAIAASLPVFYWLIRTLIGVRAAVFSTAILAVSHYLFAYAHTGYDNIFPLFPTILAFALFFAGLRGQSMLLMFGSGVAAGLGFYTFYSSRAIIVILALALLLTVLYEWRLAGLRQQWWRVPLPLGVGFAMAVAPIFAVDGWGVISAMQEQSILRDRSLSASATLFLYNIPRAFLGFNFQLSRKHYVSGSLLDEVSAVLAVLGLAYALYRWRNEGYRFLLIWFLVAAVVTGVFHLRALDHLATRFHYALPPMAAFAGLALDRIVAAFSGFSSNRKLGTALGVACFAVVMPAILGFNAHRFWVQTPKILQTSGTAVIFREVSSERCDLEGYQSVIFSTDRAHAAVQAPFEYYRWDDRMPLFLRYGDPPEVREEAIAASRVSCFLFAEKETKEAEPVIARFEERARQMGRTLEDTTDNSGRSHILVLQMPTASSP